MAKTPLLLPCPFCGSKAKAKLQDPYPPEQPDAWWTVECSHGSHYYFKRGQGCPVMPMATGETLEKTAESWNTRAKNKAVIHRLACPDCDANVGHPHLSGCDVERCSVCGRQRLACACKSHDRAFARWTGFWPGELEAQALGTDLNGLYKSGMAKVLFVKPSEVPHG